MIKQTLFFVLGLTAAWSVQAQQNNQQFTVRLSQDTILLGNFVRVSFVLENIDGSRFSPPDWDSANIAHSGSSSQSSSMSFINGKMLSRVEYEYMVQPRDTGRVQIPAARVETRDGEIVTEEVFITVLPNPDGTTLPPLEKENERNQPVITRKRPSIRI